MATFYYKAATASGEWREGVSQGDTELSVVGRLKAQGLTPVYVGERPKDLAVPVDTLSLGSFQVKNPFGKFQIPLVGRSIKQDRLEFTQEFSTLLGSGIPIDRALIIASRLAASPRFEAIIADVLRQIRGGKSLADAMEAQENAFSRLYVNMVRAGQASGSLPEVFSRLADYETRESEFRSHLLSSLIYPALLTLVAMVSMLVMLYVVVPRFGEVFSSTGLPMPASTAALLWLSTALRSYGLLFLLALILCIVAFLEWRKSPLGRASLDAALLKLPLVGTLLRKAETARFARTMATLVAHGVPIIESLRIVRETVGNSMIAKSFDGIIQGVKRGDGVAEPFERAGVFPLLAVHLLKVGEETGRLDTMFDRMATVYDNETRTTLRRVTSLFEPIIILVMGVTIGGIVLSLLMAITSINDIPF